MNDAPRRGILKKSKLKQREEITKRNIISSKRRKRTSEAGGEREEEPDSNDNDSADQINVKIGKCQIKINDTVKIKTSKFGIGYSKGRPEFTYGKVLKINGKYMTYFGKEEKKMRK